MNRLPGLRFYPTEEELLSFFLRNKLHNLRGDMECVITTVNVLSLEPWQLPRLAGELCLENKVEWFFFCPRQARETAGGWPSRRTTAYGYWKAAGSPVVVYSSNQRRLGMKKTMVFYYGRPPKGEKTLWKMSEYRLFDDQPTTAAAAVVSDDNPKLQAEFSVCRLYIGSGNLRSFDRKPATVCEDDCVSEVLDG